MHLFRDELKSTKRSHKQLARRLRELRSFIAWHYLLLALSLFNSVLTLFVVVNTDVPFRGTLVLLVCLSLILWIYLLLSGLSSK